MAVHTYVWTQKYPLKEKKQLHMQKLQTENTFIWEHRYDFRKATQVKKIPTAINPPEWQVFRDDNSAGPTIKLSMKMVLFFFHQEPWKVWQDDPTVIPPNLIHSLIP